VRIVGGANGANRLSGNAAIAIGKSPSPPKN